MLRRRRCNSLSLGVSLLFIINSYPTSANGIIVLLNSQPPLFLLNSKHFQPFFFFTFLMMPIFQFDLNTKRLYEKARKLSEALYTLQDRAKEKLFANNPGSISCKAVLIMVHHVK